MNTLRLNDAQLAIVMEALDEYAEAHCSGKFSYDDGECEQQVALIESTAESIRDQTQR